MDTPTSLDPKKKKIINLVPDKNEINEGCVNTLREALKRAKTGEVKGVAICLAVKDPEGESGRGSIHLMTWQADYRDTLFTGVGAMEFSMKHSMYESVIAVNRADITPDDE